MRNLLFVGAATLLAAAIAVTAMAQGPRPSSENHWPGMMENAETAPQLAYDAAPQYAPGSEPQYLWQEGYEHGKWHGHWRLVQ